MAIHDREWGEIVTRVDTLNDEVLLLRQRSHDLANRLAAIQGEAERAIATAKEATINANHASATAHTATLALTEAKKDPSNWPIMKRDVIVGLTSASTVAGLLIWILKLIGKL